MGLGCVSSGILPALFLVPSGHFAMSPLSRAPWSVSVSTVSRRAHRVSAVGREGRRRFPRAGGVYAGHQVSAVQEASRPAQRRTWHITALGVHCLVSKWAPGAHRREALGGSPGLLRCWLMLFSAPCWPFTSCLGILTSQVGPQYQAACLAEDDRVKSAVGAFEPPKTQSKGPSTVPRASQE